MKFRVDNLEKLTRLDVYVSKNLNISRNNAQKLIALGNVIIKGKKNIDKDEKIKQGDIIEINLPAAEEKTIKSEDIPLDIIYEDSEILIINKSPGMLVHPTSKILSGTLVNALLFRYGPGFSVGSSVRPGIVHRLDRDTSGVMVIARTDRAYDSLVRQFKGRKIRKKYIALVQGEIKKNQELETFFGRHPYLRKKMSVLGGVDKGRKALTVINIKEKMKGYTFLDVFPKTGRTHQIRVHLAYLGYPILGDLVYTSKRTRKQEACIFVKRHMLHAQSIGFYHPVSEKFVEFKVPIPEDMQEVIDKIRG